jgi:hypothetical protein
MTAFTTWSTPSEVRGLAPAGESLLWPSKEVTKKDAPTKPPFGCPAMLEDQGRAELTSLRCVQTSVASQFLKRAAHAPWSSALLGGFEGESPGSQQPNSRTAKPNSRLARAVHHTPFEPAEERRTLRPRAQRASSTDFVRLSERRVAKRVPHEAARSEYRREPAAKRRAGGPGATFCLLFGRSKRRSPAGANSRHRTCHQPAVASA